MIYGSSVFTSIIYNAGVYLKIHKDARKKVMKKLRFNGDLTKHTKKELRKLNVDLIIAIMLGIKNSVIPGLNVVYSVNSYECSDIIEETFEEEYNYIVDKANEKEEFARRAYLDTLREIRDTLATKEILECVDKDVVNNLDNDEYRPSRKTFVKAIKCMVYGTKVK